LVHPHSEDKKNDERHPPQLPVTLLQDRNQNPSPFEMLLRQATATDFVQTCRNEGAYEGKAHGDGDDHPGHLKSRERPKDQETTQDIDACKEKPEERSVKKVLHACAEGHQEIRHGNFPRLRQLPRRGCGRVVAVADHRRRVGPYGRRAGQVSIPKREYRGQ
jgi:hypothetical protein